MRTHHDHHHPTHRTHTRTRALPTWLGQMFTSPTQTHMCAANGVWSNVSILCNHKHVLSVRFTFLSMNTNALIYALLTHTKFSPNAIHGYGFRDRIRVTVLGLPCTMCSCFNLGCWLGLDGFHPSMGVVITKTMGLQPFQFSFYSGDHRSTRTTLGELKFS